MTSKVVALTLPLFKAAPQGLFHKSPAEEPVFSVRLGEMDVCLPLSGIRKEFAVDAQSEDGAMLDLIARALDFVSSLRQGDPLPTEVVTGEPSWEVSPVHKERAQHRLIIQLSTWLTGEERVFTSSEELSQIADDPNNKKKWNEAFDEAARQLGYMENGRERVMQLMTGLAEELAYIEALRDQYENIIVMDGRLQKIRTNYAHEASVRDIGDSVNRLLVLGKGKLKANFDEIDAQTGEIMSVLRNPDQQTKYIRRMRDDLYCRLIAWKDILGRWLKAPVNRCDANVVLLRDTYRFLAPRFMPSHEWALASKKSANQKTKAKTAVIW